MILRLGLLTLGLLLAGCYRPDTRDLVLDLPDVRSVEELRAVRAVLMEDQERLRDTVFYHSIRVQEDPPALLVTYNPRHLADRNVENKVNELGLRVNDLPGDPERLARFRRTLNTSSP